MLPGVGRGPAPGRGPCGRGIGRSTGCCDENGLLPTRGGRGAAGLGPGAGPGTGPGRAPTVGSGPAGASGTSAAGLGAAGVGRAGAVGAGAVGAGATGAEAAGAGAAAGFAGAGAALPLGGAGAAAGFAPPNDSRRRRATGASTVDDADLTNSPCSLSRARTSLLVTPSSLANSCTRALPATLISISRGDSGGRRRASGSAMTHGHRDFTVCSCSSLPVLLAGVPSEFPYSTTADMSGEPVMRNARANARRRTASDRHRGSGCSQAPRPGRLPAQSTTTAGLSPHTPMPCRVATTRINSTANSRFRQPTHVRTGPSARRCARTGLSRWITVQSSVACASRPKRRPRPRDHGRSGGFPAPSGSVSLRMSIRQPVSRAASRAF